MSEAFVTLATTDAYGFGACVLAHTLRNAKTSKKLVVMITRTITPNMKAVLEGFFDDVIFVDVLDSRDQMNLDLLTRPDLGVTFTKLNCWRLTQFRKAVFMDADTMVLKNVDDLFEREEFSAAPDPGWPDCFNSGVFVFVPSDDTYRRLLAFAVRYGSFDGGDQGLLNLYWRDWATRDIARHLPVVYNCVSQAFYSYLPALRRFGDDIRVVHFVGPIKPWHHRVDAGTGRLVVREGSGHLERYLQTWWDVFGGHVRPRFQPELAELQASLSAMAVAPLVHVPALAPTAEQRQLAWERGHADYLGADSFQHIQARLDASLASGGGAAGAAAPKNGAGASSNGAGASRNGAAAAAAGPRVAPQAVRADAPNGVAGAPKAGAAKPTPY